MRITQVSVDKLFGIFDHNVPFNTSERITIIHSPNGFGKTILLKMISDLFHRNYQELIRIPYTQFNVSFDNGTTLCVSKRVPSNKEETLIGAINIELNKNGTKVGAFEIKTPKRPNLHFPIDIIDEVIPELERIGSSTWLHLPTQEQLSLDEILERYPNRLPISVRAERSYKEEEWFKEIIKSVQVHFIVAQRLLKFSSFSKGRDIENKSSMVPTVAAYSAELARAIQAKLAEYGALSQVLDRTFPSRIIRANKSLHMSVEQIRDDLGILEKKRLGLTEAGLLEKGKEIDAGELRADITDSNKDVLSIYVEDAKKKLKVFDDLASKIELLMTMINKRFLYKTMSVNKKDGFLFKSSVGDTLSPSMLSSGEQHEIVLLYELLFQVNPGSLILIDEPELSLHVVWQQQFLKDLHEITKITNFDVLIATHSPQIIHDRQDLMVELKGP